MALIFRNWLPADMSSAIQIAKEQDAFRLQCPGLYVVCLLVTEHSLREALVSQWRRTNPEKQVLWQMPAPYHTKNMQGGDSSYARGICRGVEGFDSNGG